MTTYERLHGMRDRIQETAQRHGVTRIRVFGSVARQEDSPQSDIDFLVVVGSRTTPWFPAGLILELEDLLGRPVEIVTERSLNPLVRQRVLEEAIPL